MIVELWTSENGGCPVARFIESEPANVRQRIMKAIDHLEQQGTRLLVDKRKFEKMSGYANLYELKIRFQGSAYRILCVVKGGTAWLVHAFEKKTRRTPRQHIKIALERSRAL